MATNSQIPLHFNIAEPGTGRLTQPWAFWFANNNANANAGAAAAANPANQNITLSGDVSGSGTSNIAVTLDSVNTAPGTYGSATLIPVITVDAKGRITNVVPTPMSTMGDSSGTVTSVGVSSTTLTVTGAPITTAGVIGVNLPNSGVVAGTYTNATVVVDAQGRVTNAANGSGGGGSDGQVPYYIPNLSSFTVNINKQCLFFMPIELAGSGYLEVDGYLIEL